MSLPFVCFRSKLILLHCLACSVSSSVFIYPDVICFITPYSERARTHQIRAGKIRAFFGFLRPTDFMHCPCHLQLYYYIFTIQVAAHTVFKGAQPYDRRCDVYSYGILLWEMFHSCVPYMQTGLDQVKS